MRNTMIAVGLGAAAVVAVGAMTPTEEAQAACNAGKAGSALTYEDAKSLYDCIESDLHAGYNKGGKGWIPAEYVKNYVNWKPAATAPAAPGFHGNRFLYTYVNDIGWDAYTDYKDEDASVPAGTLIAKVSFSVNDAGEPKAGPLFFMEKAEAGASPKSDDWYYMMVSAGGQPQAINVMTACVACHQDSFGFQGGMGYPAEDVRINK